MEPCELLLKPREAALVLRISPEALRAWRHSGEGPPFIKLGSRPKSRVRYSEADLREWLANRKMWQGFTRN
jgi:hypothetical protein